MLALPPKKERQSLHGYVREHLRHLEHELHVGVPYRTLAGAVRAAGFGKIAVQSIRTAVYRARKKRPRHFTDIAARPIGRPFANSPAFEMQPRMRTRRKGAGEIAMAIHARLVANKGRTFDLRGRHHRPLDAGTGSQHEGGHREASRYD